MLSIFYWVKLAGTKTGAEEDGAEQPSTITRPHARVEGSGEVRKEMDATCSSVRKHMFDNGSADDDQEKNSNSNPPG